MYVVRLSSVPRKSGHFKSQQHLLWNRDCPRSQGKMVCTVVAAVCGNIYLSHRCNVNVNFVVRTLNYKCKTTACNFYWYVGWDFACDRASVHFPWLCFPDSLCRFNLLMLSVVGFVVVLNVVAMAYRTNSMCLVCETKNRRRKTMLYICFPVVLLIFITNLILRNYCATYININYIYHCLCNPSFRK